MKYLRNAAFVSGTEVAVALVLVAMVWLCYAEFAASRQQLTEFSAELSRSTALTQQITRLRIKPDQAALESHSERALAQAIEQSAAEAGFPQQHIARIEPQVPRRAGDSSYMEHATLVQLEGVSLQQLALLTSNLGSLDASLGQLHVTTLRLATPYQQDTNEPQTEVWNVEFTLTYFVYSPKSSTSRTS